MNVTVLGAGSWGSALASVLADNGHQVILWGRAAEPLESIEKNQENSKYLPGIKLSKGIKTTVNVKHALNNADLILIVVPSHAFASLLQIIKSYVKEVPIVWATKGLDPSGKFLHEVVADNLGDNKSAVLSGPSFAIEVAKNLPTAVTVASQDAEYSKFVAQAFHNDYFRVYTSGDILGVQLGGVVKNIFAVAAGVADALQLGANARAALITRGLAEMGRLNIAIGGEAKTLMGLSGVGDCVLTCTDDKSRNRRFGLALGQGKTIEQAQLQIGQVVESVHNVSQVYQLAQKFQVEMPITKQIYLLLHGEQTPTKAVQELFARDMRDE